MDRDELKRHDKSMVRFETPDASGTGSLNYIYGEDRFEIIHAKAQTGGTGNQSIDLTEEMIEKVTREGNVLVLDAKV